MTKWLLGQIGDAAIAQTPLARLGGEDDLKGLAALFASDASAHITGQIVAVDGGFTII
jgi:gluconate 5-dehydrogenase